MTGRSGRKDAVTRPGQQGAKHTTVAAADFFRPEFERPAPDAKIQNMLNIPLQTVRLAAAHGRVSEPTVRRVLAGERTRPATRARALEGLLVAGLTLEEIIAAKGDARRLGEVADSNARVAAQEKP